MKVFRTAEVSVIALSIMMTAQVANAQATSQTDAGAEDVAQGIEEIVVTAQKRGENLQDVPIAISALSGDALQAKGVLNVQEIAYSTPNLYAASYSTSPSTLFLFMRGMGSGDPMQVTKDNAIGVYENGIFNPRPQSVIFELADPERVEILRGPQGTLYGRNTTGGAVNVISRAPTGELGLRQLASYASRNQYRSITNLNLPEFGGLKIKGTLAVGGDDGYTNNVDDPAVPNTNDFGLERHVGGRIAARWEPSADFTADYSFTLARIRATPMLLQAPAQNGLAIIPGKPYQSVRDQVYRPVNLPLSQTNVRDHSFTLEWRPSDALTLRSLTGIRYLHLNTHADTVEAYGVQLKSSNDIVSKVFSQEFQAIGTAWDDRINYAAGLYYYRERVHHGFDFTQVIGAAVYDITARAVSKAAYLQVTLTPPVLDDKLDLTVGGRYTDDERRAVRDLSFSGFPLETDVTNNQNFKRFNPAFTLAYRWNDDINTYAKIATGYRAGGSSHTAPDFTQTFGPESLTTYEIGLKADLFDRRLRTNISAFYSRYKDIQLDLTLDPNNVTITTTLNAGRAVIKGFEADVTAALTNTLTVSANYAYLHTDVQEVRAAPNAPNIANLFRIPYAPKHSLNLSADFTPIRSPGGTLTFHADYNYKSEVWGTSGAGPGVAGNDFYRAPSASLVNARISLEGDWLGKSTTIALFAKNLLNNRYVKYRSAVGAQVIGYFYANQSYEAPRTIGAELSFDF